MAVTNSVMVDLFDSEVKQAYQAGTEGSVLESLVTKRTDVEGRTYRFRNYGKGMAKPRGTPASDVQPMNVGSTVVQVTLEDWDASDYSDIFGQAKINYDEVSELSQVIAAGIARRKDQIIIDALDAATPGTTIGVDVGGTASNLNLTKILRAHATMNTLNIPKGDRVWLAHANQEAALLALTQFTSRDFVDGSPLQSGRFPQFMGFYWVFIGDMDEGGLPKDGNNVRENYVFHKRSVGLAEGKISESTEVNYIPQKKSWLASASLSAGAGVIDATGLIVVLCDEDA